MVLLNYMGKTYIDLMMMMMILLNYIMGGVACEVSVVINSFCPIQLLVIIHQKFHKKVVCFMLLRESGSRFGDISRHFS